MYDRYYSSIDIWAISFGCMIGWGAFVMPGTTFLPAAGPIGTIIALAISTAVILIIGANYTYLMRKRPHTGGVYSYAREAFGRDHAFICSWFLSLSYLSIVFLNGTATFIVVRTLFDDTFQGALHYEIAGNHVYFGEVMVSVLALVVVGVMFIFAKPVLQRVHTVLSIVLLAGVVIVTIICLPHVSLHDIANPFGINGLSPSYTIFSIVLMAPWAFVGFDVISLETVHFKFSMNRTRWIMVSSIILAGFVYIALTVVSVTVVPDGYGSWAEYVTNLDGLRGALSVPTFYTAEALLGKAGLVIISITALAAILTGLIGAYRATLRMLSTMAEDKILSEKFGSTSYGILFIMLISIFLAFLGRNTLTWFVELTSLGAVIGFGYTSATALKMARAEHNSRILLTGIVGTVITIAFASVQLLPHITALEAMGPQAFLLLSLWCLLGFVFYWRTVKNSPLSEHNGISISGVILFVLLIYSVFMWFAERMMLMSDSRELDAFILRSGIILMLIVFAGLAIMLYIQNLMRRKHNEFERERIQIYERNMAKSQFLFNMSHDIRTPMNAIIGYTNMAIQENDSPKMAEYLSKIDRSNQQMIAMIDDILEMSRIESGMVERHMGAEDLYAIAEDIEDLFAEQMEKKHIDFTVDVSQIRNRYIQCDKRNLNRVLMNIISNSFKFTPEGGSISVAIQETDPHAYEFRIKDSGVGMSEQFVEKMFTAFERERTSTDSGIQGTGLGLAIVKNLTELMDGAIDVDTAPGKGTEFILRFAFEAADESEIMQKAQSGSAGAGAADGSGGGVSGAGEKEKEKVDFSQKRLLVVEDNEINREIVTMILTQAGFQMETAENGKVAVEKLVAAGPGHFDAILMDIQMPVMDGYAATKAIRALKDPELASVPVIALTANAFAEDEQAAQKAGMQAHISKPIDIHVMMKTLEDILSS